MHSGVERRWEMMIRPNVALVRWECRSGPRGEGRPAHHARTYPQEHSCGGTEGAICLGIWAKIDRKPSKSNSNLSSNSIVNQQYTFLNPESQSTYLSSFTRQPPRCTHTTHHDEDEAPFPSIVLSLRFKIKIRVATSNLERLPSQLLPITPPSSSRCASYSNHWPQTWGACVDGWV